MVLAIAVDAFPQTGQISGTITDVSGAVVPTVDVTVINKDQGVERSTKSNESGYYAVPLLPPGNYMVRVEANGFETVTRDRVVLDVTQAIRLDFQLQVGPVKQQVNVSAAALQVDTARTEIGEVITGSHMTEMPLNGRSFTDLLALQPGVIPVISPEDYGYSSPSGELNPGNLSVNGQREEANGFMVNGGNTNEVAGNGATVVPDLDSIAEFRIQTSNFEAAYGNYSGGLVNVVTKSGTNQFHGDVFEFLRNPNLDARNFYSPSRAVLHRNQFGGTIGGPIRRDKVFFFADYQGTREVQGVDTGLIPVPSQADRTGNLSDRASQLTGTVSGPFWANTLSQELGYPVSLGEPYYTSGCTAPSQCVFPNAIIPSSAITPPSAALLKYIPLPNYPGGYFTTSAYDSTLRDDKLSYRTDASTRWGTLSGYYHFDDYTSFNPYAGGNLPGSSSATVPGRAQQLNLGDTKSIGPSTVNELRLNYTRLAWVRGLPVGGVGPTLSSLGITRVVPTDPAEEGVPNVNFNNFTFGVFPYSRAQINNTFQVMDNFSKVYGTHSARFGGEFRTSQMDQFSNEMANGLWYFYGTQTGLDFADYLLGTDSSYTQNEHTPMYMRAHYYALYAQDSWRVLPGLTVNYGVRWERGTPWWELHNELPVVDYGVQSAAMPYAPPGYLLPGDPGVPHTASPTRPHDFAPRLGLAYSPKAEGGISRSLFGGPGKSSVRASYGIFFMTTEGAPAFWMIGTPPFGYSYGSPVPSFFAQPFVNVGDGVSHGQRYPTPIAPLNVSPSHPYTLSAADWQKLFEPLTANFYDRTNRDPYAEHYVFALERQFGGNTMLSLDYVGAQGHFLSTLQQVNPGIASTCLSVSQPSEVMPGTATCGPFGEGGVYYPVTGGVINGTRAPFGQAFGYMGLMSHMANSMYNGLEVYLRHTSGRARLLVGYTYSKSMDNASAWDDTPNPFNYKVTKALSFWDMTHNFVASYSYELPFDKLLRANRATRGWVLTGITRFATGQPVYMTESDDNSLNASGVDTPDRSPGKILADTNPRDGEPYFNIALFTPEHLGQIGTSNRRFFHGPGINNWDLALLKNLKLTESKSVQFRAEFFSTFNHAQFGEPDGNVDDSTFGLVTGASGQRIGQVAVKLFF
jgi:hypothetical protein